MTQKFAKAARVDIRKKFENVAENWVLYDTILVGAAVSVLKFNDGWFTTFNGIGQTADLPFFNVRSRAHGLAYNNQDKRDSLAWPFRIFTLGVSFFSPATALYRNTAGTPTGPQATEIHIWETELMKHCSLVLRTQQDERVKLNCAMAPPGFGIVSGGTAQGDAEDSIPQGLAYINVFKGSFTSGEAVLTNKWGFPNPLEVPRTAPLEVKLQFSEHGRQLLQNMPGPFFAPIRDVAADGTYYFTPGMFGIQVALGGQRLVQQRGQYHV